MALVLADRVQQTGTANTTVSFTLSGSVTGFQSFSVIGNTNTTYYAATDASGNWEVGIGTYSTTGPTLTRTTILSSSNSGSAVTFSGTVNVFVTYPSEKSVNYEQTGGVIITDNTSGDALRITQTGAGNALVVQDESPDSTPFVVNTDGRVITGATQAYTNYLDGFVNTARNPTVQFNGTSLSTASSSLTNWANADSPPLLVLAKSKSGTVGTMASTFSVGDVAGAIQFSASDNTNFIPTALIEAQIDGTPGTGDMPGRLVFSTTADGGSIPTERMRISSDGRLQINGENTLTSSLVATANTFPLNLASTAYQFRADATFDTANTSAIGFGSTYQLPATGAFSSSYQFYAGGLTTGGATITNNYGVYITGQTVGTNIYGIFSNIASGTDRYNFYANGTADNYFAGKVGIGNNTPQFGIDMFSSSTVGSSISTECSDAGAAAGPYLNLYRNSASPAANDVIGAVYFDGKNSGATITTYAALETIISSPTSGAENGVLSFKTTVAGTYDERMRVHSNGFVGIGTTSPGYELEVENTGDTYIAVTALASGTGTDDDAGIILQAAETGEAAVFFRREDGATTESTIFREGSSNDLRFNTNATTQMILNSAGNLQFNSGYGSVATAYGCRAWVNFNGTASGTFAGGTSTVTRVAGSTTATVTTTNAHGLITGNQVQALTGVVAGTYTVTFISSTQFSFTTAATTALTNASITFAFNSITASGNVSSIADLTAGNYTVNFAVAMPDANYAVAGATELNTGADTAAVGVLSRLAGSCKVCCEDVDGGFTDYPAVMIIVLR